MDHVSTTKSLPPVPSIIFSIETRFVPRASEYAKPRTLRQIPNFGSGLQCREWLFVEDCCRGIDLVGQRGIVGECYVCHQVFVSVWRFFQNICYGSELRNIGVATRIVRAFGRDPSQSIEHVADRIGLEITGKVKDPHHVGRS